MGWAGGIGPVGHEWFNQVLIVITHIRSCATGVWGAVGCLESRLVDVGGMVNRIGARVAPDFAVSIACEEACNDDAGDHTEHNTANGRSSDYTHRDTGTPK